MLDAYLFYFIYLIFGKVYHDDGLTHHKLEVTLNRPHHSCCVLISQYYLLPTCTPRFVWAAIKNQPIGTAGARLARPATHSPGSQSTGTHGVNIRASSGFEEGGTTPACRGVREGERETERYRERGGEREQANERRGSRAAPYTVILDCTSTGVCGLAGLYTSKQNKERGSTVL